MTTRQRYIIHCVMLLSQSGDYEPTNDRIHEAMAGTAEFNPDYSRYDDTIHDGSRAFKKLRGDIRTAVKRRGKTTGKL